MSDARMMRSFKLTRFAAPLEMVRECRPSPTGAQALLRVGACGVCHTDLHIQDGRFDLGHGKTMDLSRGIALPRTLGHEIVGTVEELGPDAKGVRVGDKRVVFPWGGCGACGLCRAGLENLCARPRAHGATLDGGFGDFVLVEKPEYLLAYDPVPEDFAATLACSGLTAYGALKKAGALDAENRLLIIGAGGLGLAATSLATAMHGVGPVVAEPDPTKREAVVRAGASKAVDPAEADVVKTLLKETGGFAAVIDFVGAQRTAEFALSLLRRGGRLIVVGLFGGSLELPLPTLPLRGIGIAGSYVGTLSEFAELLDLARAGKIKPMPLQRRSMDEAQKTLEDLRAGRILGRAVLRN